MQNRDNYKIISTYLTSPTMSVEYGKPHAADVPITDLDDPEDDVLFGERGGTEFIDSMDYESSMPAGLFSKIRSYFNSSPALYNRAEGSGSDFFDLSDDERPEFDIRDYRIKRLNQKLNKTILVFAVVLVFLMGVVFLRRGAKEPPIEALTLSNSTHEFKPTTIMISLDGFHPHYVSPKNTPELHSMMMNDYGAPYMVPSFPLSTFPNHWTLITGLYPSEHGIVGNTFYDPKLKKQFINTDPKFGLNPEFWKGGEPLWETAQRHGLRLAVHMWPGSEVPNIGEHLEVDRYNGSELLSSKVDRVMGWLDRDFKSRPELILTYVPTIDQYGHKFGISGSNLTEALRYVDDFVALMGTELKRRNLSDVVNLIVVSDHGMAPTSNDRLLFLDDLVDLNKIEHIDGWPLFGLRPKKEFTVDEIMAEIKANFSKLDVTTKKSFTPYLVEDIPPEWNFGGNLTAHRFNYRLAPIWIIPSVGYAITTHMQHAEKNYDYTPRGVHGYNNTELLMRAIFMGRGPYFTQKLAETKKIKPFANTEVYNMVCESLGITPAPNNGSDTAAAIFALSPAQALPSDWRDELLYPDLPFEVDHVVKDATYDLLWRKPVDKTKPTTVLVSTNKHPYESLISEESVLLSISVSLPRPSDFTSSPEGDKEEEENEEGDDEEHDEDGEADSEGGEEGEKEGEKEGDDGVGELLLDHLGNVVDDVEDVVNDAVKGAVGFFGSLFGNGGR